MNRFRLTIIALSLFVGFAPTAFAIAPPNVLSYQGRILDTTGTPVADATAAIIFRLYDGSGGGASCLWSNSDSACVSAVAQTVTLTDGLFSENLGDTGAGYAAIPDSVFANNATVYLDVNINTEPLSPRKRVVAQAFAINSSLLDGFDSSQTGGTSAIVPVTSSGGNLTLTGDPSGAGVSQGSFYVNPSAPLANETILGVANGGSSVFRVDAEGDTTIAGSLSVLDLTCTNCLDFAELANAMTLDASTSIAMGAFDLSTSGTGAFNISSTGQATIAGNLNATNGVDVTNADLTVGGVNFSVAQATGNIITAGDAAINGGDVTSTGTLTIDSTGTVQLGTDDDFLPQLGAGNADIGASGTRWDNVFAVTGDFTGTVTALDLTCTNCLDFTELANALTLDASTSIAMGAFDLSTSGTGALNFASTGQATIAGNLNATNGVDVTNANLTVGGSNFSVSSATGATSITPSSNVSALSITGTNVTTTALENLSAGNTAGNIINLAYGASTIQTDDLFGQNIDLSTNLTTVNGKNLTGYNTILKAGTHSGAGTEVIVGYQATSGGAANLTQNTAGGTINWEGFASTIPAITQTTGTVTADGIRLTIPDAPITTGGTTTAVNIVAAPGAVTGATAGTLIGIGIGNIPSPDPGTGTHKAMTIGTGWGTGITIADINTELAFSSTSPTITVGDTGTLTIGDGSFDLFQVGDTGTSGNITVTGGTILSASNANITLSPNGTGDVVINPDANTNFQLTATAAPGVDMMAIDNSGGVLASATSGVDALAIKFAATNSGDALHFANPAFASTTTGLTYNVIEMDAFSPTNTTGIDNINGVLINTLTDPGATIKSTGININSGWDTGISIADATNEIAFTSPTSSITLGDTGTLTLTDDNVTPHTLFSITDTGTTGDATITGNLTVSLGQIFSASNANLALKPNGTGDVTIPLDGDTNVQISAADVAGVDMLAISATAANVSVTSGVDGIAMAFGSSNASGDLIHLTPTYAGGATDLLTFNGFEIAGFAPANGAGTDTVNGISIGTLTDPGATITSTAISIGTGWDTAINVGTGKMTVDSGGLTSINLGGVASTNGLCHSGANVDVATDTTRMIVACSAAPADYAEWYDSDGTPAAGDVVALTDQMITFTTSESNARTGAITGTTQKTLPILTKATSTSGTKTFGIVSTSPIQTIGSDLQRQGAHPLPIVLNGRIPLHVNDENGAIALGDALTPSSTAGFAMKAKAGDVIVASSLGTLTSGMATIEAFARFDNGQGAGTSIASNTATQTNDSSLTALNMNGNIYMNGNSILAVASITGMSDRWSIAEDGTFSTTATYKTVVDSTQNTKVDVYASMSPDVTLTLSGTSTLSGGRAVVNFIDVNPDFNSIISTVAPIRVVVTPDGPTGMLYVSQKDNNGFTVEEVGDNTTGVNFDWMVVAYRNGYEPAGTTDIGTPTDTSTTTTETNTTDSVPTTDVPTTVSETTTDTTTPIVTTDTTPTDPTTDTTIPADTTLTDTTTTTDTPSTDPIPTPVDAPTSDPAPDTTTL